MSKVKRATVVTAAMAATLLWTGPLGAAPICPETLDPLADYKCVIINVGVDKYGTGTATDPFYELGITGSLATSIYTPSIFGPVRDTNIPSVLASYGVLPGTNSYPNAAGTGFVSLQQAPTVNQQNIDSLNDLGSGNLETQGLNLNVGVKGYRLTYQYDITGVLSPITGPSFNSGFFDVFYDDLATAVDENIQVLRVNVTGSAANVGNIDLFGLVTFDFNNDNDTNDPNELADPFVANFWSFQIGGLWSNYQAAIRFHLDTNVNPPIPTPASLGVVCSDPEDPTSCVLMRQTTLDSSVRFVPEPSTLAVLGLGLLCLGAFRQRRIS